MKGVLTPDNCGREKYAHKSLLDRYVGWPQNPPDNCWHIGCLRKAMKQTGFPHPSRANETTSRTSRVGDPGKLCPGMMPVDRQNMRRSRTAEPIRSRLGILRHTAKLLGLLLMAANSTSHAIVLLYTEWGTGDIGILNSNGSRAVYATTTGLQSGPFTTDAQGNLFLSDNTNQQIIKVSAADRSVSSFASGLLFNNPIGLAFDGNGNLYVSNYAWTSGTTILKIDTFGSVSVFANVQGGGSLAFRSSTGDLYVGNYYNSQIDQIDSAGNVSVFRSVGGTGNASSILFDTSGNFYFTTQGYGNATPTITKVAPNGSTSLFWTAGSYSGSYLGQLVFDPTQNEFYAAYGTSILRIDSGGNAVVHASNVTSGTISGLAILAATVPDRSASPILALGLGVMIGGAWLHRRRAAKPAAVVRN